MDDPRLRKDTAFPDRRISHQFVFGTFTNTSQGVCSVIDKDIFEDLFVLELANNHLGSVERGLRIIQEFAQVVRFNNVRATIKLQFRDVGTFVHKDYLNSSERYIAKTLRSALTDDEYATLVKAIRQAGCIPTATPFDER